jgi:uncharacterized protein YecT (DUF1311 family)
MRKCRRSIHIRLEIILIFCKKLFTSLTLICISHISFAQDIGLTKQYSQCMETSNGVTMNMIECINAETKRQDLRINNAYKTVMDQLSPERKKQLQQAQRAWINYRDANCQFYFDPDGGSLARVNANVCFMNATATRSHELETMSGESALPAVTAPSAQSAISAPIQPVPEKTPQSLSKPQINAVRAAQSYLNISAFSRDGLIEQLSSSAGSGFNRHDATIAVDSMNVDWNREAVKSAKQYLQLMGFSCKGLIQQLSSPAGGKFTEKQAIFGAQQAGAC